VSTPSRPLLIGLLATLAIAGVWFVALKPPGKGADSNSQFNAPIANAQKAVVQSQVAAANAEQAAGNSTPAAAAKPATPVVTPKPAVPVHPAVKHVTVTPVVKHPVAVKQPVVAAVKAPVVVAVKHPVPVHHTSANVPKLPSYDKSGKIFAALARGNVAVVLFWTQGGSDDSSVRRAVQSISGRHHVSTFVISMKDVGKYEALTSQYEVNVSPTVLIFGPKDEFIPLVGYTTAPALNQYINSLQ
jgi:hypothetical protein